MIGKRTRTTLESLPRGTACLQCKKRKKKCDAGKPSCANCVETRRGSECSYPSQVRRKIQPYENILELEIAQAEHNDATCELANDDDDLEEPSKATASMSVVRWKRQINLKEIVFSDHNVDWWKLDELPVCMRDFLFSNFLHHASQVHYEMLFPSIATRLFRYPTDDPSSIHPALVNAMCLLASFFLSSPSHPAHIHQRARWDSKSIELSFLRKTRRAMIKNPPRAENYFDFLLATGLLSKYLYFINRYTEGYEEASAAIHFALACNFHKISSPHAIDYPRGPSPLPPPKNDQDVMDRQSVFWGMFIVDRGGGVLNGTGPSLLEEPITTVLPQSLASTLDAEPPLVNLNSLHTPGSKTLEVGNDNPLISKIKYTELLDMLRRFIIQVVKSCVTSADDLPLDLATEFCRLDESISIALKSTRPVITLQPSSAPTPERVKADLADRAMIAQLVRGLIIRLHGIFSLRDELSRNKAVHTAKEIVKIARSMDKKLDIYWQLPINMAWANAAEILQQEIARIRLSMTSCDDNLVNNEYDIVGLREDMLYLATLTKRYIDVFRFNQPSLQFIEDLLTRDEDFVKQISGERAPPSSRGSSDDTIGLPDPMMWVF